MPSSRSSKPIIIPATPKTFHNLYHSNLSPSTPPSPKQVRFAHPSTELASRPLTPQEAWSLYHFETHARACHSCDGRSICDVGHSLSQDVRVHVWKHEKQLCSTRPDSEGRWVRVEIPHGYGWTKAMLGVERTRSTEKPKPKKSTTKSSPVVSYDPEPRPARKTADYCRSSSRDNNNNSNIYVEPARTPKDDERRSRHRPERYEVVEVAPSKYEQGGPVRLPERAKRGSLYESDMRRPRREYRVEERVPDRAERGQGRERVERESEKEREERRERRRREREWRE